MAVTGTDAINYYDKPFQRLFIPSRYVSYRKQRVAVTLLTPFAATFSVYILTLMVSKGCPSNTPNVDATLDDTTCIIKNRKLYFFDIIVLLYLLTMVES